MRSIMMESQNNARALELRLEKETPAKYLLVLAGMTIHIKSGCSGGRCEPTGEDEFMFTENVTYLVRDYPTLEEGKKAYEMLKAEHID